MGLAMRIAITATVVICASAVAAAAMAQPMGMPARRAGFWETVISAPGMPSGAMRMRVCADPAREHGPAAFAGPMAAGKGNSCSEHDVHPTAAGWTFHTVCATPHGPSVMTGTLTGDFRSHYHLDMDVRSAGQAHRVSVDARWLGPCAPGTPNSIVLPNGRVVTMPKVG